MPYEQPKIAKPTRDEQLKLIKMYESRTGEKIKPGFTVDITEEEYQKWLSSKGKYNPALSDMGRKLEDITQSTTPPVEKPIEQPVVRSAEPEPEPYYKMRGTTAQPLNQPQASKEIPAKQDLRGYRNGQQTVGGKIAEKLTGQQSLRRAAELSINKMAERAGLSFRFAQAKLNPVTKK